MRSRSLPEPDRRPGVRRQSSHWLPSFILALAWLLAACAGPAPAEVFIVTREVTREVTRQVTREVTRVVQPTLPPDAGPADTAVPSAPPEPSLEGAFLFAVEDVFSITGRGTVVTGEVLRGRLAAGEAVDIVGFDQQVRSTTVTSIEVFQESAAEARAGDRVTLLLRGIDRDELARGMVIAAPGSIQAHDLFEADVYFQTVEEGGRNRAISSGYRPQFFFRTIDLTGELALTGGAETALPGSTVSVAVQLSQPVALEPGTWFAVREGGQQVGYGVVTGILD